MTGAEFRVWREMLSLAQEDAARALGLSKSTIQRYEAGTLPVPLSVALGALYLKLRAELQSILNEHAGRA